MSSSISTDSGDEPGAESHGRPARSRRRGGNRTKGAKKQTPWYIEIPVLILVAAAIVFVFQTFVGRVYRIPSESMEPTLHGCAGCTGDRIFVDKITYEFSDPEPGDVVVFKGPESWNEGYSSIRSGNPVMRGLENVGSVVGIVPPDEFDLVKRVIAVGGQTVGGCAPDGRLMVDGKALDEPYLNGDPSIIGNSRDCDFGPVKVPDGRLWVMGDNRNNSADSRFHMADGEQGTISTGDVIGKVQVIILPVSRISGIDSPDIDAG